MYFRVPTFSDVKIGFFLPITLEYHSSLSWGFLPGAVPATLAPLEDFFFVGAGLMTGLVPLGDFFFVGAGLMTGLVLIGGKEQTV